MWSRGGDLVSGAILMLLGAILLFSNDGVFWIVCGGIAAVGGVLTLFNGIFNAVRVKDWRNP